MESKRCGQKCEVFTRIVGYYRPINYSNQGKKEEFIDGRELSVPEFGIEKNYDREARREGIRGKREEL